MKKTLLVIAAAAMIFGLAGCNQGLKAEAGSWGKQRVYKDEAGVRKAEVELVLDTDWTPTWWKWTDIDGNVLETQPTGIKVGNKLVFKFLDWTKVPTLYGNDETENMILYVESSDGTKDVRGRICVYRDKIVEVPYSKYKEEIAAVTEVKITNDEPTADSCFTDGNYEVTEIWTLSPKEEGKDKIGDVFVANDGLKIKFPQNKGIKNDKDSNSKTILVKAGGIVGLYQPKRAKTVEGKNANTNITAAGIKAKKFTVEGEEKTAIEIYHLGDITDDDELVAKYTKNNADIIFANKMPEKHPAVAVKLNTSEFGTYYFKHDTKITRWKAAENDYVTETTAIPADLK